MALTPGSSLQNGKFMNFQTNFGTFFIFRIVTVNPLGGIRFDAETQLWRSFLLWKSTISGPEARPDTAENELSEATNLMIPMNRW